MNQLTAYVNAKSGGGGGGGGGSGTGNVLYSDTTATVGQHYKISSTDGTACVKSDIVENNGIITFNNNNLQSINYITVNRITCNQIVKSGLAGFFRTNGLIDYNTYATPTDVSNFYLSKLDAISTYLNKNDANFIYLSKDDANFIYLSKSDALSITGSLDTRIISLETKNQYQNTQPNQTNFSGTVQAEMLKVIGTDRFVVSCKWIGAVL